MAHPLQVDFFSRAAAQFPNYFAGQRVLEIGSLNINGTVRDFFKNCAYIGIDLGNGPGVDVVCSGEDYRSELPFGVTISTECFEHNPKWDKTFENMLNLTASNGLIIVTSASIGRGEHGTKRTTPHDSPFTCDTDYYRNLSIKDFTNNWNFEEIFKQYRFEYTNAHCDLYFVGVKN